MVVTVGVGSTGGACSLRLLRLILTKTAWWLSRWKEVVRSSGAGPWLRLLLRMFPYSNTCWSSEADSKRGWYAILAAAVVDCGALAVVVNCGGALVPGLCVNGQG